MPCAARLPLAKKLSPSSGKCQLSSHYLAGASVGRRISDVGGRGTPDYRRKWQEAIRLKRVDMVWIVSIFSKLISF
jgi:hypothetical protein